jgi:glycosyltransferase involved in cell wall biosynthesis
MKRILWLTSWYPNLSDPFNGDFIKREAEAVSKYVPLKVVFAGKYRPDEFKANVPPGTTSRNQTLEEHILYYPSAGRENSLFSRFNSLKSYVRLHLDFLRQLRKNKEWPDLVHVHVAMKAGLIALYLKFRYGIPYVLTEHWSGYYPISKDSLYKKSFISRFMTKLIIKNAVRFLPVSEDLGKEISQHWVPVSFQRIPNVVNTRVFFPSENKQPLVFRFIHISSLLYPKNPEGIVRVFSELTNQGYLAELTLVGPVNEALNKFILTIGHVGQLIRFTGEISYEQVAVELRNSSALVMFSDYETMSCVVIEALCTGLPVISSRVGGIPEVVSENNGILINPGNEKELLRAMIDMINNYHQFHKARISQQAAEQFSYEVIGNRIADVYHSVLDNK